MRKNVVPIQKEREDSTSSSFLHQEIDNMLNSMFRGFPLATLTRPTWSAGLGAERTLLNPSLDLKENKKHYEVCAELPGVTEKDVKVTLNEGLLTISGEKAEQHENEQENYHVFERSFGKFRRQIELPNNIDEHKVQAKFKDGVLRIQIPKTKAMSSKTREIPISK